MSNDRNLDCSGFSQQYEKCAGSYRHQCCMQTRALDVSSKFGLTQDVMFATRSATEAWWHVKAAATFQFWADSFFIILVLILGINN